VDFAGCDLGWKFVSPWSHIACFSTLSHWVLIYCEKSQ